MDVDHLHGGKLLQHAARRQSRRQRMQAPRERDVQGIGQKGNEDVRLDASLELVKDRSDREVALEVLERFLDRDQQQIMVPQLGRVFLDQVGAQQIPKVRPAADLCTADTTSKYRITEPLALRPASGVWPTQHFPLPHWCIRS